MGEIEPEIKGMDISDLTYLLRSKSDSLSKSNFNNILEKYSQIKIKNSQLEILREEFFIEQLKEKLKVTLLITLIEPKKRMGTRSRRVL